MKAVEKNIKVSPRKLRLLADAIRGLDFGQAVGTLSVLGKRAAQPLSKALHSAASNATAKGMNMDNLFVKQIEIMEGPRLKRFHPSSRGRAHPYKKRQSHIKIILEEKNGTKN